MKARTLLDKLWDSHVIYQYENGWALLHIDRQLLHDLSGTASLNALSARGLSVHNPELVYATPDHAVSSAPGRDAFTYETGGKLWKRLHNLTQKENIRFFDIGQRGHGIVHVMAPELGLVLPGLTVICGDSHTCTNGALGALAFGVGSSELVHALATQTLKQRKPKSMRIRFKGTLSPGVTAKDLILYTIGRLGASAGTGYAVEYAGPVVRQLSMEQRMTLCNLSIEFGAKMGFIAPDKTTFEYIKGRQYAPQGITWDQACEAWSTLSSDADARFDHEVVIDASEVAQMITWGISPEHVIPVDQNIPDIDDSVDDSVRKARQTAAEYMGLTPGVSLAGTPVDRVFIGSCTNAR